jgi:hypothetical protein
MAKAKKATQAKPTKTKGKVSGTGTGDKRGS